MIILFANQKGGVGKSTLAVLFSNYLSLVQNKEVIVFDMDNQQSIYTMAQNAAVLENKPLYEVELANKGQFETIKSVVKDKSKLITILDIAGNIEDNALIPIFQGVDLIICPFFYDEFSVNATIDFSYVVKALNDKVNIIFIPNRVKSNARYETLDSVNKILSEFGAVTKPILDRVDMGRMSMYTTPQTVIKVVSPIFDLIYNDFVRLK
uniref:ParA family protein n=1 Tax=Pedobacter sp. TaxID=1411316 RepID=UPI00159A77D7|nr:ParA family protein [Pedobacter sp.]QJS06235.1 partitioning protein, ParA [Pedobacter sp.]